MNTYEKMEKGMKYTLLRPQDDISEFAIETRKPVRKIGTPVRKGQRDIFQPVPMFSVIILTALEEVFHRI
jgi:hypothetical protein